MNFFYVAFQSIHNTLMYLIITIASGLCMQWQQYVVGKQMFLKLFLCHYLSKDFVLLLRDRTFEQKFVFTFLLSLDKLGKQSSVVLF